VRAHGDDLRAEVADTELCDAVIADWRHAPLERISKRAPALCAHAEKLTREPRSVTNTDIELLRQAGCDDAAIFDLTGVVGLFNLYNRIASGLGIDDEPDW